MCLLRFTTLRSNSAIIGDDFNITLSDTPDKKGGLEMHSNQQARNELITLMKEYTLFDVFREKHQHEDMLTRIQRNPYAANSQDYFLITADLMESVKMQVKNSVKLYQTLCVINVVVDTIQTGPGYWKFNCALLNDAKYTLQTKRVVAEYFSFTNSRPLSIAIVNLGSHEMRCAEKIKCSASKKRQSKNRILYKIT